MANYKQVIPQIGAFEGGLSKAQTDSARFDPVPDGSGYHTNKGITWATFKNLAPRLGYTATPDLFYKMPEHIWERIFKNGYWDSVGGDHIKSQAIANTLADFAWGAGPGTAAKVMQRLLGVFPDGQIGKQTIAAINKQKEKDLFTKLTNAKKQFYLTLPGQQANYAGWKTRLDKEWTLNQKLIVAGVAGGGLLAGGLGLFFY